MALRTHSDAIVLNFTPQTLGALRHSTTDDFQTFWIESPYPVPIDAHARLQVELPEPFCIKALLDGVITDMAQTANDASSDDSQPTYLLRFHVPEYAASNFKDALGWLPVRRPADRSASPLLQRRVHVENIRCFSSYIQEFDGTILDVSPAGAFVASPYRFYRDESLNLEVDNSWVKATVMWSGQKFNSDGLGLHLHFQTEEQHKQWLKRVFDALEPGEAIH